MSICSKSDCVGCYNDFYNHRTNFDGKSECWNLKTATKQRARDVPISLCPPFLHLPFVVRPSCYRASGFVRVKPEDLTADGLWR